MPHKKKNVTKKQDGDGHWYWIPNEMLEDFKSDLAKIDGKDYIDCPDDFDYFMDKYDTFRTLGDPDNVPRIFE